MTKQNDHKKWFNYVVNNVNCITFYDSVSKIMMTTIHDSITEKYTYFNEKKRFKVSRKFIVDTETVKFVNFINVTKFMYFTFFTNSVFSVSFNNQLQ